MMKKGVKRKLLGISYLMVDFFRLENSFFIHPSEMV